eukprot:s962_g4.t1
MADQKDQIWLWGAVLQGHVITHFVFRILDHPDEAHSGKPRGHGEMLKNINILGLRKGDTFVSDGWKATDEALPGFCAPNSSEAIAAFTRDLVRGRKIKLVALNGSAVDCWIALDKQLRYLVVQRQGKKESKRRAVSLESVDQVCVGEEAQEESGLQLHDLCVCFLLQEGQAIAFALNNPEERDTFALVMSMFVDHRRTEAEELKEETTGLPSLPNG